MCKSINTFEVIASTIFQNLTSFICFDVSPSLHQIDEYFTCGCIKIISWMSDKFSILMDLQNDVVHVIMAVFGLHIAVTHVYDRGEAIKHISSVDYFK